MIKLISFIVLTHLFQFNQLKILTNPCYRVYYYLLMLVIKNSLFMFSD